MFVSNFFSEYSASNHGIKEIRRFDVDLLKTRQSYRYVESPFDKATFVQPLFGSLRFHALDRLKSACISLPRGIF